LEGDNHRFFYHDPDDPNSLSDNDIFVIHEDADGMMWVGTNGGGLNRVDPETGSVTRYVADPDDLNSIMNDDVRTIYEDQQGNLWIGSYNATLTRMDRDRSLFFHFDINQGEFFFSAVIQDILEDQQGRLWLATRGGGLKLFDRERREVARSYTVNEGLAGNMVHALVEDNQGMIWLTTNNGISRFDPERKAFQNYDDKSGVQRSDFFYGSRLMDRGGYIYFGGFNGFNRFHPDNIRISTEEHPVVFTDFLLYNRSVPIGPDSPLDRHISLMDTLILPYDATVLTFRYSALNFSVVKGNRFAYMLDGFDDDWNYVGEQRVATYTNLSPGTYTLRVMATNNDGIWAKSPAEITLIITPPFWKTAWFISLSVIVVVLLLFAFYRLRVHAINAKNIELERKVEERTIELSESNATKDKLLSIIGHDLNNVAFGMIGFVQLLKDSLEREETEEVKEYTNRLYSATMQFHDLLSDLLTWASSQSGRISHEPEWIQLKDLLEDILTHEESRAMNKKIQMELKLEDEQSRVYADPNMLSIVLRNLINNAVKFTHKGGRIGIWSRKNMEFMEITVEDNGVGMTSQQINDVLKEKKRTSTKGTENERGTGLGLSLCQDFVEKNGGTFRIESEQEKGSRFIFTVPMHSVQ
ncbi:two-component regulator propeller domain-containing protein, partial [Balneolaceae bacterium ANBcel3]|nr:two-component regulator propeller domain-containing protein [Balneolaceae bacterium ANBcel3]